MPHLKLPKPSWLHKPAKADFILFIVSLIISILLWSYIASTIAPGFEVSFSDIPVTLDITNTKAEEAKLSVISVDAVDPKVSVVITGNRSDIGGLKSDEISAYVDFDSISTTNTGKQVLPIKLRTDIAFSSAEITPPTLGVTLDYYADESFKVVAEVDRKKVKAADTEVIIDDQNISCVPDSVTVSGPTDALNQIDHIRVIVDEEDTIDETKTYSNVTRYELIDKNGAIIDESAFNVQKNRYSVTIPVYYMKMMPITVTVSGTPTGFDTEWLMDHLRIAADKNYKLAGYGDSNKMILLKTSNKKLKEELKKRDFYSIGEVPLSNLSPGGDGVPITVKVEDGFTDASNLGTLTLVLDETDLVKKPWYVENSDIQLTNGAPGYHYNKAPGRTAFTVIGSADEISKINASDLQASVSLLNADSDAGTFSCTVLITLPDELKRVWISPLPMLSITAEKKPDETTQTTQTTVASTTTTTEATAPPSLVI